MNMPLCLQVNGLKFPEEVEKPELYILTHCPSKDQQLMYSALRSEDIEKIQGKPLDLGNLAIFGKIRFFKGNYILVSRNSEGLLIDVYLNYTEI